MNCRNAAAAAWFLLAASTEFALPPFSELAAWPALNWGSGATRHWPLPPGTPVSRSTPIQPPITRLAMSPLVRPWYHWSLQEAIGATRPPDTSGLHVFTNFCEPASAKLIVTFFVPLVTYGCPPAAQIIEVRKPGSPVSLVMYAFGLAVCSFLASSTNCAQVVGTGSLYLSKTVLL